MAVGQDAVRALTEALSLDVVGPVEASPEVLPHDGRRQLGELLLTQVLLQGVNEVRAVRRGCLGKRLGILEDQPLDRREHLALPPTVQVRELRLRDAGRSAHGRVEV